MLLSILLSMTVRMTVRMTVSMLLSMTVRMTVRMTVSTTVSMTLTIIIDRHEPCTCLPLSMMLSMLKYDVKYVAFEVQLCMNYLVAIDSAILHIFVFPSVNYLKYIFSNRTMHIILFYNTKTLILPLVVVSYCLLKCDERR